MELDKKILPGRKPLTCFDIDEAEKYVGKKCYISNEYDFYRDLDFTQQKILTGVEDCEEPFHYDQDKQAEFCLPCEWVKESEKKYRAFTISEFIDQHEIGDVIHYRSKSGEVELRHMYVGTRHSQGIKKIIVKITLGNESHTLDYLFENYEIEVDGEWKPFGIEDED